MDFVPLSEGFFLRQPDNRYRIIRVLGKGGMGAVYLAEDTLSNEKVAIKQLFHHDDPELSRAFKREARLLAQLKHPAFPRVTDHFNEHGSQFLVMDYIEGKDLGSHFDKQGNGRPMPLAEVINIADQLFVALKDLHEKDILHRDLKPRNLMMLEDGSLKVVDLGAAKGSMGNMSTKDDSIPVYTPGYAPPEQIDDLGTDVRSDIFSAAATLYHLLAGQMPQNVKQRRDAIYYKKRPDPLLPVDHFNSDVSIYVSKVFQQAMSLDPEDRPSSVAKMRRMLFRAFELVADATPDSEKKQNKNGDEESESSNETVEMADVFDHALGKKLLVQSPPHDFQLPPGHHYLSRGVNGQIHLLFRERDKQIVIALQASGKASSNFFIDKYLITNEQYADFLNDENTRQRMRFVTENGILIGVSEEREVLLGDAKTYWAVQRRSSAAWGLTFSAERWGPVPGSEKFPATLVTVLGASWYSAWARQRDLENIVKGDGLPTDAEWELAGLWDFDKERLRSFPWGLEWDFSKLNNIGFWAGRNLEDNDPEYEYWREKALPTAVGSFMQGASMCEMADAYGNVWEWVKQRDQSGRMLIKGGACTSRRSTFLTQPSLYRQDNFGGETIGFRCCWSVES